jgi:hypothetical protein
VSLEAEYQALRGSPDPSNPYGALNDDLRKIIVRAGIADPGPTLVGEYPHQAYNAKAQAVPGGTLILLNTGLNTLLLRVALTLAAATIPFDRDARRRVVLREKTDAQRALRETADAWLADAVLDYIHQRPYPATTPPDLPEAHLRMAEQVWYAAERFVAGHEFGHLLAGHLHRPPSRDSLDREFEADELALLLIMRTLDDVPPIIRGLLIVGPFLFLALDHLITRVRNTVLDLPAALLIPTHPPSDVRASALRAAVNAYGDPSLMRFADAMVNSLSTREDLIVRRATRQ